ncbi:MAG: hypothetical protein ACRCU0_01325 [Candidatus Rhabdochlamydia sp.]
MASIVLTAAGLYSYNPYKEAISAFVWGVTPRAINVLTSKPTENASKIDYIREKLFGIRTQFLQLTQTNKLTKYSWFILNDVIIANMGFATLFFLATHLIDRTELNTSSRGFLIIKLLTCFPIAALREESHEKNKDWGRDVLPTEEAWIVAKGDFNNVQRIIKGKLATSFGQIPCILFYREEFQKRRCTITNQPIREAVVIRETPTSSPIYYEYNNLSNWFSQKGDTPPLNWPESIPFDRDAIVIDQAETIQITEDLQKALNCSDVKDRARKCLPELEKKLREEIRKRIDSLSLPDWLSLEFNDLIRCVPISRLIDMMQQIERLLEDMMRRNLDELINEALRNRVSRPLKVTEYPDGIEDKDPILSKWTCAISHQAIRIPVTDVTNGKTVYDIQSLQFWLIISDKSPVTRLPLDKEAALTNFGCIYDPLIHYRKYCLEQKKLQDKNAFITNITAMVEEVNAENISENTREFFRFIYICPISKQPINHAIKVKQESRDNVFKRDVYYEQSAIQIYLESPERLPPNWPKDVAFCQDNLTKMSEEQLFLEQIANIKENQAEWLESLSS